MTKETLFDACCCGELPAEDSIEMLIDAVGSPENSNASLIQAARAACRRQPEHERLAWMDNLMEFSLWETGTIPWRLELCDYMVRSGEGRFDSPQRWACYGGLTHVACEAASMEAILWCLERDPWACKKSGGSLGISVLHSLCNRNCGMENSTIAEMLISKGADPNHKGTDGRNPLFRCLDGPLASALMDSGASPWELDNEGYCAASVWLELGFSDGALRAFQQNPKKANEPMAWGSFLWSGSSGARARPPKLDTPLFIVACSSRLGSRSGIPDQTELLEGLCQLGADPLTKDASGRSLADATSNPCALSLMERAELSRDPCLAALSEGRPGRL